MRKVKNVLYRLLFPGRAFVFLSIPIAAGLLFYTFLEAGENSSVAYVTYVFSA